MKLLKSIPILQDFVRNFHERNLLRLSQMSSPLLFPSDAKYILPIYFGRSFFGFFCCCCYIGFKYGGDQKSKEQHFFSSQ